MAHRQVLGQRRQVGVVASIADCRGPLGDGGLALWGGSHQSHLVEQLPHGVDEDLAVEGPARYARQRLGERGRLVLQVLPADPLERLRRAGAGLYAGRDGVEEQERLRSECDER